MDARLQAIFIDLTFTDSQYVVSAVRGTSKQWRRFRSFDQAREETRQELTRVLLNLDERGQVPQSFSDRSPEEGFKSYGYTCMKNYWIRALAVQPAPTDEDGQELIKEPEERGGLMSVTLSDVQKLLGKIIRDEDVLGPAEFSLLWSLLNDEEGASTFRSVAIAVMRRQLVQPGKARRPLAPMAARQTLGAGDLRIAFNRRQRWSAVARMAPSPGSDKTQADRQ